MLTIMRCRKTAASRRRRCCITLRISATLVVVIRLGLDQSCDAERKRYRPHRPSETVPPLRTRTIVWRWSQRSASGLIDVVMSDHNPQTSSQRLPFAEAAAGAIGLQTMLPAGLRLIHNGEMDSRR